MKVAAHNRLAPCDPDTDPADVTDAEIGPVTGFVRTHLPSLAPAPVRTERCFYATTADGEFHLGRLPSDPNVSVGAFAGHGFKFAPVIGEILADLATGREPRFDLSRFRPDRAVTT